MARTPDDYPIGYDSASYLLNGRQERPLRGTATRLWADLESRFPHYVIYRVRYHETDIVSFHANGACAINTGGWNGPTTFRKINACLPAGWRVFIKNGIAHIKNPSGQVTHFGSTFIISHAMIEAGNWVE